MSEPELNKGGAIGARLSIMMFLEFFLWGAWYVTMGPYLADTMHMSGGYIGWAYALGPIAAIVSPFFLGMVADRFFATERVLAVMQLLGGVALFVAPAAMKADPQLFLAVVLLHMLFYMPTLGLTNTLAFHHMTNQEKQFPLIRVWGTIGWIIANLVISALHFDRSSGMFYVAGGSAILFGLYSFTLPHTPPPAKGQKFSVREALGLDALTLMKERSFAVFIICSFLICIPLSYYYSFAGQYVGEVGFRAIASTMSLGQMSEIFFMLMIPLFFARLGVKYMLLVGMLAWVARYGLFAGAADHLSLWMVLIGVGLHGLCYDFFFVTGFIYVDKKASKNIRGAAQGFLVLVTQGLGMFIGAKAAGWLVDMNRAENFKEIAAQIKGLQEKADQLAGPAAEQVYGQITNLHMQATDWQSIWLAPCLFAAGVMVIFFLLFNDRVRNGGASDSEVASAQEEIAGPP